MSPVSGWADIGINFLVGEDGNTYEGSGWDRVGEQTGIYSSVSISVSLIGSFMTQNPNAAALSVTQQLIACGIGLVCRLQIIGLVCRLQIIGLVCRLQII